ncbi:twin-arginine translocation pathway signal [Mycobacterium ahvazicum]|uniref:twin-arginine translocation pathway signal n=1 Tax=Mycobacterium ahvazicum TaxID=1964395 RepID=UPI001FAECE8F|nr:twin-arginine translocation pathway signal [Mycobacterium ahvazicum]
MTIRDVEDHDITPVEQTVTDSGDPEAGDAVCGGSKGSSADAPVDVRRSWLRRAMSHWPLLIIGSVLVAAAAVTAELYFGQFRSDQHADDAAAASAIRAATDGTVALLSYTPDKLDGDLAAAKSRLTGDFLTYYSKFSEQIVAPAAKTKAVNTQATVKRAAITELHPDSARVLVFLDQTTTSKDAPEPVQTASSVMVGLTKVHGVWLISAFDPT